MTRAGSVTLTDQEVDGITVDFLRSPYVEDTYGSWSLDRRLESFLRRSGLGRLADDGDLHDLLLRRAMAYLKMLRAGS
ncbi:hypothetical protein ACXDF8_03785 [Mycolicibacterium sp. CBM1]